MDDQTKRAIFDELMEASGVILQQPHHFTCNEFADSQCIGRETAMRILEKLRGRGLVDRERILTDSGKRSWGYWRT